MGAQHGPIDCPSMGHGKKVGGPSMGHRWECDGPSMAHRWPMDGLPWDPNSGMIKVINIGEIRFIGNHFLSQSVLYSFNIVKYVNILKIET